MSQTEKEIIKDLYLDCDLEDLELISIKPHGVEHKQIDGTHYLNKIQPWDIIDSWGLNFYEGNILKYLLRSKDNRVIDLKKLIHYAEKLIEIEQGK